MLVQLSPWETTQTSIHLSSSRSPSTRRRKRDDSHHNNHHNDQHHNYPPFAASFISMASKRGMSKMKVHSSEFSDCLPMLTVTSEHHISVLGKRLSSKNDEESSSSSSPPPSHPEFSSLQYTSRPGAAGSFFAKPVNGKFHPNDLPSIPAIVDTKNDRVYAFQHDNYRLCCWNTWKDGGPDEKTALKVELRSPALSMTLLPMNKGVIYGTCQNGSVFVARVVTQSDSKSLLVVEYLPSRQPKGTVHIGTLAEILIDKPKVSGRKRKMSDADGNSTVVFYQVFCDGITVKIVRHDVSFSLSVYDVLIRNETLIQKISSIDMLDVQSGKLGRHHLTRAELLVSSTSSSPKVSLVYTMNSVSPKMTTNINNDRVLGTFCVPISLSSTKINDIPIRLPPAVNQFGLVAETVLAASTDDTIYLYDLKDGALLQTKSLKRLRIDMDGDWILRTDTKHGVMAIFFSKDDILHVSFTTATLDGNSKATLGLVQLKSSAKLAGSLLASSKTNGSVAEKYDVPACILSEGMDKKTPFNSAFAMIHLGNSVEKALMSLEDSQKSSSFPNRDSMSLCEAFDCSLSRLTNIVNNSNVDDDEGIIPLVNQDATTPHNPQDPSSPEHNKPNIVEKSPYNESTKTNRTPNGNKLSSSRKKEVDIPIEIPQPFIDGAVEIVMSTIHTEKKRKSNCLSQLAIDARYVLKRLIRTGRVSARLHFESSYPLQETSKKHPLSLALQSIRHSTEESQSPLSATQLIIEMLQHCSDLSERQLVIFVDYMIRFPQAKDIAGTFFGWSTISKKHDLRQRSRKFVDMRQSKKAKVVDGHIKPDKPNDLIHQSKSDLENELVVSGVELVLHLIVCYSECNELMLRVALSEGISSGIEAVVLAQMLTKMLTSRPSALPSRHRRRANFVRCTCLWIAALCESFKDELLAATTSSGQDYLSFLLNSLKRVTRNSEAIISFKDGIGIAEAKKKDMEKQAKLEALEREMKRTPKEEELPGYSIDRVVF